MTYFYDMEMKTMKMTIYDLILGCGDEDNENDYL